MARGERKPTLKDVAALSGVSVISASRVMRDSPNISRELRERVEAAARKIGYQRNMIAGSLRGRSTDLIAVLVPSMSNHVFPQIVDGISDALKGSPLRLVLGMTQYDEAGEETILRDMLNWNPAGVVLSGIEHSTSTHEMLKRFSGPVVEVMDSDGPAHDLSVGVSMGEAGQLIARHLVERGYRRIGYVGAWGERPKRSRKRRLAFDAELMRLNVPLKGHVILEEASSMAAGARGLGMLLAEHPDLDAVFFTNDDLAIGALHHCQARGIRVPQDLALAGFNGIELGRWITPQLTTISTPRYEMGRLAGRILRDRTEGKGVSGPRTIGMKLDLVIGDTT